MSKGKGEYGSDKITRRSFLNTAGAALGTGIGMYGGCGFLREVLHALDVSGAPEATFRLRSLPKAPPAMKNRPNILFILGDNHNAGALGCSGHPFIKTPAIDGLAREGVLFERAYNTTSLCSPSRASILTGLYAHRHGVKNNHTHWTGGHRTFLEHLSVAGYRTAFIGKWHMPGRLPELPFLDLFVTYTYREGQGSYFNCPMLVNGRETPSRKPYITAEVTDYAIEFIEAVKAQKNDEPFCVYLSHRPSHPPYASPAPFSGMYNTADVKGILPSNIDPLWFGKTDSRVFQGVMMGSYYDQYRRYCETLTAMDADIARLLGYLDRQGLRDDTVVIYMSDNGMMWGAHDCHGIREPYEDSTRLPFIVRAPGIISDPGGKRSRMVLNIDIAPTLLEIAGVQAPGDFDGMSIVPVLRNARAKTRDAFLLEFWRYFPEPTPTYRGIRTERYKYIEFERGRTPWLFDLARDPGEMENIYGRKDTWALTENLRSKLREFPSA